MSDKQISVIEGQADHIGTSASEGENTHTAVAVASPFDIAPADFTESLKRRDRNRKALIRAIQKSLVDGVDYGSIPTKRGPSKPSLRKPGAEKICGFLGVSVRFPNAQRYEVAASQGVLIKQVVLRCELRDSSGHVLAEGVGARDIGKDQGDLNKSLKMAAKSAHIDATLRLAGLSEVFTQDLEDMVREMLDQASTPAEAPKVPNLPPPSTLPESGRRKLEASISSYGLERGRVKSWVKTKWNIDHFADLSQAQADELLKQIETVFPLKSGEGAQILFSECKAQNYSYPLLVRYVRETYKKRPDQLDKAEYEECRLFIADSIKSFHAEQARHPYQGDGEPYDAVLDSREPGGKPKAYYYQ